jgi:hypothetical protein
MEQPNSHAYNSSGPKQSVACLLACLFASSPSFQLNTPYVQSASIGRNLDLEKPFWPNYFCGKTKSHWLL